MCPPLVSFSKFYHRQVRDASAFVGVGRNTRRLRAPPSLHKEGKGKREMSHTAQKWTLGCFCGMIWGKESLSA